MAGAFSSAFSSAFDVGGGGGGGALLLRLLTEDSTMLRQIRVGTTDVSVVIRIVDSTTGAPETAVEHNSAGIDLWYRREGAVSTDITEAALAALTDAHSDGGLEHINDGYYRLDLPDAACASGATGVQIGGVVDGMVVIGCYVELVAYNPYDTVRLGLTALPNAAADGAGGLPISDAGGLDLDAQLVTKINDILTDTGTTLDGRIPAALVGGRMDANVGAISSDATAADNCEAFFDGTGYAGTGNVIPTVTTLTGHTPQTGDVFARVTGTGAVTFASLTVSGTTTLTGAVAANGGVTFTSSTGDGFTCSSTGGNGDGLRAIGNGTGDGFHVQGGATGNGIHLIGGGTSGAGAAVVTTNGHGISVAATGASKHGIIVTGGNSGTCDGVQINAGTGGVDLRSDIVGDITGSLSGSVASVSGAVGSVSGAVGSVTGAVGSVTGSVGSVASGGIAAASFAAGAVDAAALAADAANEIADALLDRTAGVETNRTVRQAMRLILASLVGKLSGAATTTVAIRDTNDSKDRISATVDADGNRSAVTLDAT